jgi:hypothetical protein
MIPIFLIALATICFFVLERVLPGRELPEAPGWYVRATFLNACQVSVMHPTNLDSQGLVF